AGQGEGDEDELLAVAELGRHGHALLEEDAGALDVAALEGDAAAQVREDDAGGARGRFAREAGGEIEHGLGAIAIAETEVEVAEIETDPRQPGTMAETLEGLDGVLVALEGDLVVAAPLGEDAEVLQTEGAVADVA